MPITFEPQYLNDVVKKQEDLVDAIALQHMTQGAASADAAPPQAALDAEKERVKEMIEWLAARMSVSSLWES